MSLTFVPNGNQILAKSEKERELILTDGHCRLCGGEMIDDDTMGRCCSECGRCMDVQLSYLL